jgi:hypothetical protein
VPPVKEVIGGTIVLTFLDKDGQDYTKVNKFGAFCQNSLKFDEFGLARIQKSSKLLFINSKK